MRRLPLVVIAIVALVLLGASPARAQAVVEQAVLTAAAEGLRTQGVYVDPTAERAISPTVADRLEASIEGGNTPLFVAVLPGSAVQEAGGDPGNVPASLARATGRDGTYAVLVGDSFRAESNVLSEAGALATSAFEEFQSDGPEAVLTEFVGRVQDAAATGPAPSAGGAGPAGDEGGDGTGGLWLLVLVGVVGAGLFFWFRARRLRERETRRRETAADRQMLRAELSVLGDDVLALESEIALHPDARADYDAGVSRYRAGEAALEYAGADVDFVRVGRVIAEGRYAMNRARARVEGREPPPPPEELRAPGRHNEPALDVDDRGEPVYAGGTPFYGGGWYGGGGNGLFTGLLLGQMLGGGWGWGGGYGHHDHGGDGGGDGGGSDSGGGDWGGGGGGDWGGGGDFGGGDFGGGGDF